MSLKTWEKEFYPVAASSEKRKRLRELAEKATPGPWEAKEPAFAPGIGKAAVFGPKANGTHEGRQCIALADAEFIAAAREAVPALLDDVDRLEAENAALRARVEKLVEAGKQLRAAMIRPCADAVLVEKFEVAEEKWREVTVLEIPLKVLGGLEMAALDRAGEK